MTIKNKLFATSATAALVASAIVPIASANEFHDAKQIPVWAEEAVEALVNSEVLQGDDQGYFNPTGVVTRAAAAEILYKALELPTEGTENFPDVNENNWFYKAVVATAQEKIFEGDDKGLFNPNDVLTREQAAAVIVRAFGLTGEADLSGFADADSVSSWAKDAVKIAVANGVIKGDGTSLNPGAGISRAEMAVMVHRVLLQQTDIEIESAPVVESVTLESADTMVIEFKEAIGSEVDVNKMTVAGFEGNTAKELTGSDFTASVTDNKLTLTAKDGIKFATGSEGNGGEGNLISFAEQAVVSKDSAISIEATDIAEGTIVDGKLADVSFVDNAAPVFLFAQEVAANALSFTFTENIKVEGEVAPQFTTIEAPTGEELLGERSSVSGNTLKVVLEYVWQDANTVFSEVTVDYVADEVSYIADAFGNKVATTQITGVQEREKTEYDFAVEAAEIAVTSLTTKLDELTVKIENKTLTGEEVTELFTLRKTAQEAVNAVVSHNTNHAGLNRWNNAINKVPFVAVGTVNNENEATITFSKPLMNGISTTDIKNALKPVKVGEEVKNTADYYFGDLDLQNGAVKLKKTGGADATRWGAGLEEGKVEITIDQNSTFGQQLSQLNIKF